MKIKKIRNIRLSQQEFLFFLPYTIFIVFNILSQSFYAIYIENYTKMIIAGCCALIVFKEAFERKYYNKSIIGLAVTIVLFLLTLMGSRNAQNNIPAMFLFIYAARNIKFKKIARYTILISTILLIFIILSAKLGIINEYRIITWENGALRDRNYLGFRYALYPSTIVFNITCLIVYLKKKNLKIWLAVLLLAINYWFYVQTNSRLTFVLSIALVVIAYIYKWVEQWLLNRNILLTAGCFSFIICFFISFFLTFYYDENKSWMKVINSCLGSRLSLGKASLIENGIPILGQNIGWVGNGLNSLGEKSVEEYTYVDSLYIQVLQHYGIIFTIIFLILMTIVMFKIKEIQDIYLYTIMVMIAFHYIIDDLQLYLFYNTFWLLIGQLVMVLVSKENLLYRYIKKRRSE